MSISLRRTKMTRRRKIVINIVMLCVTIFAAWAFNSDASIFSFTHCTAHPESWTCP